MAISVWQKKKMFQNARDMQSPPSETPSNVISLRGGDTLAVENILNVLIFDPDFYRSRYLDVAEAGIDPVDHYFTVGWREGRQPNAAFDPEAYQTANPDVRDAQINPFAHYLLRGYREGRPLR
ncbi:hypothetical protein [Granulibacter bethesdensis]|uniref:Glycosyltransferase n=2 Tax=Granulibacter bethesdensis TaxID=364410 RepID=Q0BPG5_GRABC|nr:hypothetical protein [Granulibacter bethesdensis]ABI63287.1 putative glycosyltransferase [Granulibacter bethesdensis CGDNIH1]AHJ64304.1 putative glycosyltransferase [Granulibacter bethesdensis]AHJ66928.1 putative glycosyltransferase [Granulibacter bethesdensis CGDNIH4]AHJ69597.1 putative glycosyltransferase [Granulibacter bethesdensis]APH53170.1 putative glycosyltransferase [Granulibacter bethesdensis]